MIPSALNDFMCFNEGGQMTGMVDINLSNVAYMTETLSGAGIMGELELPITGKFQSLTMTINWRSLTDENIIFLAPRTYHFDLRGSVELYDPDSGQSSTKGLIIVTRLRPKTMSLGTFAPAANMGTNCEFEILYLLAKVDRVDKVEIDKLNYKFIVDGTDYMEGHARNLGLR